MAFLTTIHPVRVGIVLLMLSRPRPLQNLLSYWAGCTIALLITLLVPLAVIHAKPAYGASFRSLVNPTPNSTSGYIAIGTGVVSLSVAALIVLRSPARRQSRLTRPRGEARGTLDQNGNANASTLVLDSSTVPVISRLMRPRTDAAPEGGSVIRQLLSRARDAWENGSPWVAFVGGFATAPAVDLALVVLALIVASGVGIAMQFSAAIAFIIVMLAVEEIILVSSVTAPAKTQALLRRLHDWALAHRRKLLAAIFAVVGISMMAQGMGVL